MFFEKKILKMYFLGFQGALLKSLMKNIFLLFVIFFIFYSFFNKSPLTFVCNPYSEKIIN